MLVRGRERGRRDCGFCRCPVAPPAAGELGLRSMDGPIGVLRMDIGVYPAVVVGGHLIAVLELGSMRHPKLGQILF